MRRATKSDEVLPHAQPDVLRAPLLLRNKIALGPCTREAKQAKTQELFSCWHLRSLMLQTARPHPFKIEKRCSNMNRKLDFKINVAIRQWVCTPVRKKKKKFLDAASFTLELSIGVCTYNTETASLVNAVRKIS